MHRLILFRHAKSDRPLGVADPDRPLSKRGRRQAERMGRYAARKGCVPDLALVSPSRRTRETWDLAVAAFPEGGIRTNADSRLYAATAGAILDLVRLTPSDVGMLAVVGHNPGLQDLAVALLGKSFQAERERLAAKFPTGAIAVIDFDCDGWDELSRESGRLAAFATPKSVGA